MHRSITGGLLLQDNDAHATNPEDFQVKAGPQPSDEVRRDAAMAWTIAKHLKSNAICIAGDGMQLGAGAGQMDRVAACRIAVEKMKMFGGSMPDTTVAASDAFFPFPDGPEILIKAGVQCIIQPGGSKRDEETFKLCQEHGVTCLTTGIRHFKH